MSLPQTAADWDTWRLRFEIPGIAAAGVPVHITGHDPDDHTELQVTVAGLALTLPPYFLTPPSTAGWSTRTDKP